MKIFYFKRIVATIVAIIALFISRPEALAFKNVQLEGDLSYFNAKRWNDYTLLHAEPMTENGIINTYLLVIGGGYGKDDNEVRKLIYFYPGHIIGSDCAHYNAYHCDVVSIVEDETTTGDKQYSLDIHKVELDFNNKRAVAEKYSLIELSEQGSLLIRNILSNKTSWNTQKFNAN